MEQQQRQTAYKLSIGALLKETPTFAGDQFNYIEILGRKVARVSIIANVIDKYVSQEKSYIALTIDDGTGQIQIKLFDKLEMVKDIGIGDTILVMGWLRFYNNQLYILPEIIKKIDTRWTMVRRLEFEKMGMPTTQKPSTPQTTSVQPQTPSTQPTPTIQPTPTTQQQTQQKVETEKVIVNDSDKGNNTESPNQLSTQSSTEQLPPKNIKESVLDTIKKNEEGIDIDKLIMELNYPVGDINSTITELTEEGKIYEPQPGKVRSIA